MRLGALSKLGIMGLGIDERDVKPPIPHEYLVFDGYFASTPISEYEDTIDGGFANSSYDRIIECGKANKTT